MKLFKNRKKKKIKFLERFKWKLNAREIQENIQRLKAARKETQVGTDAYDKLQTELQKEYEILKKFKDGRFAVPPQVIATLCVVGTIAFFAICLDQESPKALKLAQFVLKIFKW